MIFTFNQSVQQGNIGLLARSVLLIAEKHHHLLLDNDMSDWLSSTILDSTNYLGSFDREALKNNREVWRVTGVQQKYQTKLTVGLEENTINIEQLYKIVNEPSYVVLENSMYDWSAICRWVDIYRNERDFKTLNESVFRAIKEMRLRGDHSGGGNGTIANRISNLKEIFQECSKFKVTTIYDSDKDSPHDTTEHNKVLNEYLKSLGFIGHELHKREIENYFSVDTLRMAGMINENVIIPKYTPEEYDFLDIENAPFVKYKKKSMPKLAQNLYKAALKERVAHHKVSDSIDEIQFIIITLSRFI